MRLVVKVFLFPLTLLLSLVVAVGRFLCMCSGALLSVAALLLFTLALLSLVLMHNGSGALFIGALAFSISPYGLPRLAEWLMDRLEDLNFTIKSI